MDFGNRCGYSPCHRRGVRDGGYWSGPGHSGDRTGETCSAFPPLRDRFGFEGKKDGSAGRTFL